MRQLDIAAMFVSLWLLMSMIIDVVTPKELTVFMIGAAVAPSIIILAVLSLMRFPRLDFVVIFGTLWLATGIVLQLMASKPLSAFAGLIAFAPLVVIGATINFQRWRKSQLPPKEESPGW